MKIAFVCYEDPANPRSFPIGVGLLSGLLKKEGHRVRGFYIQNNLDEAGVLEDIVRWVKKFEPDLIAYSCTSPSFNQIRRIAAELRLQIAASSICGGPHPTLYPEETLAESGIDYVCVGEGERSLLDFVNALGGGGDCSTIPGVWSLNKNKQIVKNRLYPLVQDLDNLPWIDYEVFGQQHIKQLTADGWLWHITSRGCPYDCSYCHSPMFRKIYSQGIGMPEDRIGYVRFRSADSLIEELITLVKKYNVKVINFADDLFCFRKSSILEFCRKFKQRLPEQVGYSIQTHLYQLDEEIIASLVDSRCKRVIVGVESGSERILKLLNRKMPLEKMNKNLALLVKAGFAFGTCSTNMLGIPTETKAEMLQTLKLNAEVLIERVKINIMAPYSKSRIYDLCLEKDLFVRPPETLEFKDRSATKVKFSQEERAFLERLFDVGHWYMNLYAPLGLKSYYQPLIEEIEQIGLDEWPQVRGLYLKRDVELSNLLEKKAMTHYKFILRGKVHSKEIGLSTLKVN